MPTVLGFDGFKFFFYSNEGHEPAHIHVLTQEKEAKFWLADILLATNRGIADHEITVLRRHIFTHRQRFLTAYSDHFGS